MFKFGFKARAPQGVLSRLTAIHLNTPQNATSGSAYRFLMGGTTAGKPVTERSAMQMTAVYSCVRVLAEAVAGLPLHLYTFDLIDQKKLQFNVGVELSYPKRWCSPCRKQHELLFLTLSTTSKTIA